jgi:hypothetical protein
VIPDFRVKLVKLVYNVLVEQKRTTLPNGAASIIIIMMTSSGQLLTLSGHSRDNPNAAGQ